MGGFFDYVPGNSLLHRLNPLTKLIISVFLCAACFAASRVSVIVALILIDLLAAKTAGIEKRAIRMVTVLSKFCIFLFIVQLLLIRQGEPIFTFGFIKITWEGVRFSLLMSLKLIGAALPLALILSVTKLIDLSNVLVSKLGIPFKYAFALTTAIRFIPVFSAEMQGIMETQTARGVRFDTKNFFKKIGLIIPLCVPLLITSVSKIDEAAISAELRGFNRRKKNSGYKTYPFTVSDIASAAVSIIIFAAVLAL